MFSCSENDEGAMGAAKTFAEKGLVWIFFRTFAK